MISNLINFLTFFFKKEQLELWAPISLRDCTIRKPYLLEREGIRTGTAFLLAVPYFTHACTDPERNLSAYAVPRDYHGFFSDLFGRLLPALRTQLPQLRFAGFADHSPIDEVDAANRAGLGVLGDNHLLLTESYSSYIFLGELITDAEIPCSTRQPVHCPSCGSCQRHCPAEECGGCLSALTQKKGVLSGEERACLLKYGTVWGCDICQEVCPYTLRAIRAGTIFTPIPYFQEQTLPHLTAERLDAMTDEVFRTRSYAWRGRETVRRNLLLTEHADINEEAFTASGKESPC